MADNYVYPLIYIFTLGVPDHNLDIKIVINIVSNDWAPEDSQQNTYSSGRSKMTKRVNFIFPQINGFYPFTN